MTQPSAKPSNSLAAGALLAMASACLDGGNAHALDFGSDEGRRDSTIAYTESLKTYDNIKKFGAERVEDRDRQMYLPDGIRSGDYLVYPSLGVKTIYDDNIYAQPMAKTGDLSQELAPAVRLRSQFNDHILDFNVTSRIVHFDRHSNLDFIDGSAGVDGALHFDHAHTLSVSLLSSYEHDDRANPEAPKNASEFVPVFHNRATMGLTRDSGQLYATFSATAESWQFQNVKAFDGSTIDQRSRDLDVYKSELKLGYRFSPGYEWQGKLRVTRNENTGTSLVNQTNWGYEALSGLSLESNPLLRFHLLGGYGFRAYDQTSLGNTAAGLFEGQITWLPTQLMTVYLTGRRELVPDITTTGSGRVDDIAKLRVDYEILRNLVISGTGGYTQTQYSSASRADETVVAGLGLQYFHTKNILFTADYQYLHRMSTLTDFNLERNKFGVGVKIRF